LSPLSPQYGGYGGSVWKVLTEQVLSTLRRRAAACRHQVKFFMAGSQKCRSSLRFSESLGAKVAQKRVLGRKKCANVSEMSTKCYSDVTQGAKWRTFR